MTVKEILKRREYQGEFSYNAKKGELTVEATSSQGGSETLEAESFDADGNSLGTVSLSYNSKKARWSAKQSLPTTPAPATVTVYFATDPSVSATTDVEVGGGGGGGGGNGNGRGGGRPTVGGISGELALQLPTLDMAAVKTFDTLARLRLASPDHLLQSDSPGSGLVDLFSVLDEDDDPWRLTLEDLGLS